ncbi:CopD family protein [Rhodococcoides kyotonense]|uniref:Putative copper resistance protein D n=1 Tax=Rhodococcoides kyotonense TaxID=398843 RepID=A0A239L7Y3_9NOCA|nr:CopD family protein [Rhodococcus kyotonensis]SNT26571.1 putative copper resistance protein D [Rhodococcus kyotonensis]
MFRRWWILTAGTTAVLGVGAAWLLARPDGPDPSSILRVLADCLGATALGLALLRTDLFPVRSRPRVWQTTVVVGGLWTAAEVALLVTAAVESFGGGIGSLPMSSFGAFLTDITVGQLGVVTVLCTAAVCVYGLVGYRGDRDISTMPVAVAAVVALVARPITGHMSQQLFGALFVAVHTVAAAVWLGVLAAMALTLRAKGAWAQTLPVYSRLAWWSVWILAASGTVNAAVKLGGVEGLVDTGYGRVVLAKTVVLVGLVLAARRLRATWLVSAAAHRTSLDESVVRAGLHISALTIAFGLAAALATTA